MLAAFAAAWALSSDRLAIPWSSRLRALAKDGSSRSFILAPPRMPQRSFLAAITLIHNLDELFTFSARRLCHWLTVTRLAPPAGAKREQTTIRLSPDSAHAPSAIRSPRAPPRDTVCRARPAPGLLPQSGGAAP